MKPTLLYLGLTLLCLLVIAFVPGIALWLTHALGIEDRYRAGRPGWRKR